LFYSLSGKEINSELIMKSATFQGCMQKLAGYMMVSIYNPIIKSKEF
jgi:hypothetical protein